MTQAFTLTFVKTELQSRENKWLPADVEMALFAYAGTDYRGLLNH